MGRVLPFRPMLDPRSLQERRDEILESCESRHIKADVDGTIALHEQTNVLRTALNEANRLRNEHQKTGKQKLDDAAREAHTIEGRRLKEGVSGHEETLRTVELELDAALRRAADGPRRRSRRPPIGDADKELVA